MNLFIQNNLYIILLFFFILIILLTIVVIFLIVKLILDTKKNAQTLNILPKDETVGERKMIKKISDKVQEKFHCLNHQELPSLASCLICEEVFCDKCIIEHSGMYFCKEHFRVYTNHKWIQVTDQKTTPDSPESGQFIWDLKRQVWKKENIPSFILTHYKINIENDYIESFIQLNIPESHKHFFENELKKHEKELS